MWLFPLLFQLIFFRHSDGVFVCWALWSASQAPWEMKIYIPIFWEGCWELGDLTVPHFGSDQWPHSGQFFLQGQTTSSDWSLLGDEDQSPSTPAGRSLSWPVSKLPMAQMSPSHGQHLSCPSLPSAPASSLSLACNGEAPRGGLGRHPDCWSPLRARSQEAPPAVFQSPRCSTHTIL